jgi:transcriptional regulator with XRE-family HTH domain
MTIGNKIAKLRHEHGMTTQQLADKLYVSRGSITNWENETSEPHLYALIGMAELFGVTLDELCCRVARKKRSIDNAK